MGQNTVCIRRLLERFSYSMILLLTSGLVLVQFLYPAWGHHMGINDYSRARFLDMVEWKAYKPFVYRTLLPTTVRLVSMMVPEERQKIFEDQVVQNDTLHKVFSVLGWEYHAAFQYFVACLLMYLSLVGFGHSVVLLTQQTCSFPNDTKTRLITVVSALMGVTFLFRYVAYIYDPPQLFLFTLALYLLSTDRIRSFYVVFVFCCLNKETAILLIPLFAMKYYRTSFDKHQYYYAVGGLVMIYLSIRAAVFLTFYDNPGTFVEFQFLHNIWWFTSGRTLADLLFISLLLLLIFFRWREKPLFLRVSFLSVLLPLVGFAAFLGFIEEWRGYYEAYPLAFGLIVQSLLRVQKTSTYNQGSHIGDA